MTFSASSLIDCSEYLRRGTSNKLKTFLMPLTFLRSSTRFFKRETVSIVKISLLGVKAMTRKSEEPYFLEFSRYVFKSGSLSSSKVSDDASN